jgi:phage baseplate assembly protein gpV
LVFQTVAAGETLEIPPGYGQVVAGPLTVDGTVTVDGTLTVAPGPISGAGSISGDGHVHIP